VRERVDCVRAQVDCVKARVDCAKARVDDAELVVAVRERVDARVGCAQQHGEACSTLRQ